MMSPGRPGFQKLTYGAQLHSDKLCESDRTVLHHWQKLVDQRSTG